MTRKGKAVSAVILGVGGTCAAVGLVTIGIGGLSSVFNSHAEHGWLAARILGGMAGCSFGFMAGIVKAFNSRSFSLKSGSAVTLALVLAGSGAFLGAFGGERIGNFITRPALTQTQAISPPN